LTIFFRIWFGRIFIRKASGLLQDSIRNTHLSYVMEVACNVNNIRLLCVKSQRQGKVIAYNRHLLRMVKSNIVFRINNISKRF